MEQITHYNQFTLKYQMNDSDSSKKEEKYKDFILKNLDDDEMPSLLNGSQILFIRLKNI